MSSCQKDVKCQIVKHLDYGGGSQKINWHNEVHTYWHQFCPNCQKILSMNILRVFSDHHLWCQNGRQYLWTSLCQFNFFVNLLHSLGVWIFDIWHLFDNLTSFQHLGTLLDPCGPHPLYPLPMCPYVLYPILLYPIAPYAPIAHTPVPYCPMCPHCPCGWYSLYPIPLYPTAPCVPIAHVAHTPCTLLCHMPHCPCGPYPLYPLPMWPIPH